MFGKEIELTHENLSPAKQAEISQNIMEMKKKEKPIAIVLVSGGMDSLVTAALADLEHEMAFLHLNYGQRTEKRELKAFNDIADFYKVEKRLVVDVQYLREIGGSALTDEKIEVPIRRETRDETRGEANKNYNHPSSIVHHPSEIPITYVPFRNAHLLCIAVSWAEVIGARKIYIGAVEEDSSGYPDCREIFYKMFEKAIDAGTKPETKIQIITPLIHMRKGAIVKKGVELGAPFQLTWSCYLPPYPPHGGGQGEVACGRCDSCRLRVEGFKEAGVFDPIQYDKQQAGQP